MRQSTPLEKARFILRPYLLRVGSDLIICDWHSKRLWMTFKFSNGYQYSMAIRRDKNRGFSDFDTPITLRSYVIAEFFTELNILFDELEGVAA